MPVLLEDLDVDTGPAGPHVVLAGLDIRTLQTALRVNLSGISVETLLGEVPDPDSDLPMSDTDTVTITVVAGAPPVEGDYSLYVKRGGAWRQVV